MTTPAYPQPRLPEDRRFTLGLLFEMAGVLEKYGYPRPEGADLVRLEQALFRFVYVDVGEPPAGADGGRL